VDVKGNLSSPVQGVGACTNNGGVASTALTQSGVATVEGGAPLKLPQTLQLPTPPTPPVSSMHGPGGNTDPVSITNPNGSTCGLILQPPQDTANCSVSGNVITLKNTGPTPLNLPYMALGGQTKLVLTASDVPGIANSYNFNAIQLSSTNNSLKIESPSSTQDVKINIAGMYPDGTNITTVAVVDIGGGADVGGYTTTPANPANTCAGCSQFDASLMQIIYGGTGTMNVAGNPSAAVVYYAPNAAVSFSGNSSLYGAIIAKTLAINGGGNSIAINYDQNLAGKGMTASAPMIASFSWKKY
jgi:hypothetical protein